MIEKVFLATESAGFWLFMPVRFWLSDRAVFGLKIWKKRESFSF
jgi:hypothetical protein